MVYYNSTPLQMPIQTQLYFICILTHCIKLATTYICVSYCPSAICHILWIIAFACSNNYIFCECEGFEAWSSYAICPEYDLTQKCYALGPHLGCFIDNNDDRALQYWINNHLTIHRCIISCRDEYYTYAGLEVGVFRIFCIFL